MSDALTSALSSRKLTARWTPPPSHRPMLAMLLWLALSASAAVLAGLFMQAGWPETAGGWLVPAAAFCAGLCGAGIFQFVRPRAVGPGRLAETFTQASDVAAVITTPHGELLESNPAYRRLFKTVGRLPRDPHELLATNGDEGAAAFRFAQTALSGETHVETVRWLGPGTDGNNQQRWLEARVEARQDPSNATSRMALWQFRDVTPQKHQLQEWAKRSESLRAHLDSDPAGRLVADESGAIVDMNTTMRGWLQDRDGPAGPDMQLSQVFSEASASLLMSHVAAPRKGGATRTAMLEFLAKGGETTQLWGSFRSCPDPHGNGTLLHVTVLSKGGNGEPNQKRDADTLDAEALFHTAPIAIATVNAKGKIATRNQTFSETFAIPAQRGGTRLNVLDLVDETAREPLSRMIADAAAHKPAGAPLDIAFARAENRAGRLYVVPTPGKRRRRSADAAMIYAIDTTEQRTLEEQIAQKQKMQEVGQLAGGIAHDFNNLLTGILGYADLLLANHRASDPAFKDIMEIRNNANRAAALVRHLLAYSRRQTLRPTVLSLTDVIEDFGLLLNRLIGEKVTAHISHARDLWMVKADANQLEQVLMNLAVNARDAMMPGGGELTIRTANVTERDVARSGRPGMPVGEYVLLQISDNGCGMPPDVLERIFEPFFSTKEIGEGTGFGLSVVHGIVKQTGGFIFADSRVGEGTTFSIYLPRHVEEESAVNDPSSPTDAGKQRSDLTGKGTVLLVEDEEAVRRFAARALESRGYKVLKATTGVEALEVLAAHEGEIDLVISDVMMPEMDGPKLLQQMRKTHPDMTVIFISGYAEEALRQELAKDESFIFLPKPFSLKDLASAVKEALG